MTGPEVLIVGAGPTGLTLALWLARLGVGLRIIDRAGAPGETSRAAVVQARILEFYQQIGIAQRIIEGGIIADRLTVRRRRRALATAPLQAMGRGLSMFPYILSLPQDEHERLLVAELRTLGIEVERNAALAGFRQGPQGVHATLETARGTETVSTRFICGCDGAHSAVRRGMAVSFPGGTYSQIFYVADASAHGEAAAGGVQVCISSKDFCLVFPVRNTGTVRLIGTVPPESESKPEIGIDDVTETIVRNSGLALDKVHWFSTYHVHHRIAEHFHDGNALLAGDAAHIHSPAGGQGMNTGIGDAVNLAWKLAAVVQGRAAASLLDSYQSERMAFARVLVKTTDTGFRLVTNRTFVGRLMRSVVLPTLFPLLTRIGPVRRLLFRVVSQIRIHYRGSALSRGRAGAVHGGDRLPWLDRGGAGNYASLASLDWQVHVYGVASPSLRDFLKSRGLALHELAWGEDAAAAGLARDAAYLLRPDGHVALADPAQDTAVLERYLGEFGITPRASMS